MFVYFFRTCKYQLLCGTKQIKSEAYCYREGSKCEKLYKKGEFKHLYESNPDSNDIMTKSEKKSSTKKQNSKKHQCGKGPSKAAISLRIIGKISVISFINVKSHCLSVI